MGEKLQNLKPREATCRAEAKRRRKPYTRMAKREIRFQRFALSFRLSAPGHCCFRFPLAFSLQPLAFARALASGINITILGVTLSQF
jgi:hypothetical protein